MVISQSWLLELTTVFLGMLSFFQTEISLVGQCNGCTVGEATGREQNRPASYHVVTCS